MNVESLIAEVEINSKLLAQGRLSPVDKYRCKIVFTAMLNKAETEEIKILMRQLLKVLTLI